MWRWLEQTEAKHAEFERSISFFGKMGRVWMCIGSMNTEGRAAYAKKQSAMWRQLEHECKLAYEKVGIELLRCRKDSNDTLAERIVEFRRRELKPLVSHSCNRSYDRANFVCRISRPSTNSCTRTQQPPTQPSDDSFNFQHPVPHPVPHQSRFIRILSL
jgi:hypothetical protein